VTGTARVAAAVACGPARVGQDDRDHPARRASARGRTRGDRLSHTRAARARLANSEPINDRQAFTPSVDVGADGTLSVTYYDFRENTRNTATLLTRHYAVHCHPATENCANPVSWDEETAIGPAFNIREAAYARGYFLGDHMGLD
jgi:hypothetical protein